MNWNRTNSIMKPFPIFSPLSNSSIRQLVKENSVEVLQEYNVLQAIVVSLMEIIQMQEENVLKIPASSARKMQKNVLTAHLSEELDQNVNSLLAKSQTKSTFFLSFW